MTAVTIPTPSDSVRITLKASGQYGVIRRAINSKACLDRSRGSGRVLDYWLGCLVLPNVHEASP
jgi:hypothetical protein